MGFDNVHVLNSCCHSNQLVYCDISYVDVRLIF